MKNTMFHNTNPDTRFVYLAMEGPEAPASKGKDLVQSITDKEQQILDAETSKTESAPEG